jgi:putative transcriptional regulator
MKRELFANLIASVQQATDIARGARRPARAFRFSSSRVRAVRERIQLSQAEFARFMGVSVRTLQNWEQERRAPTGPAAALLKIVEHEPEAVLRTLHGVGSARR